MEITQQPSTIGAMSLEHFEAFFGNIIMDKVREATNARFDAIEAPIARLELRMDKIEIEMKQVRQEQEETNKNSEYVKDLFYMSESRFGLLERSQIRMERKFAELPA